MDPAAFRAEHARLTTELTAADAVVQRLKKELDDVHAAQAAGAPLPPAYAETQWLLNHQRTIVQTLKQARDRLMSRRGHAIDGIFISLVRQRFPKPDVERLQRQAAEGWEVSA